MDESGLSARFRIMFMKELDATRGVGSGSKTGQAVLVASTRVFESLLGAIAHDLADEQSELRKELAERNVEVEWLRSQLDAASASLREAQRTGRPGLLRKAATGLAALMLSVSGGAAGGAAQAYVGARMSHSVVSEYAQACDHFAILVEEHEVELQDTSSVPSVQETAALTVTDHVGEADNVSDESARPMVNVVGIEGRAGQGITVPIGTAGEVKTAGPVQVGRGGVGSAREGDQTVGFPGTLVEDVPTNDDIIVRGSAASVGVTAHDPTVVVKEGDDVFSVTDDVVRE